MTVKIKKEYSSTGAKDALDVGIEGNYSFLVNSTNSDAVFTVEGQLTDSGDWGTVTSETLNNGELYGTTAPVDKLRLNIASLGTSSGVTFEIYG